MTMNVRRVIQCTFIMLVGRALKEEKSEEKFHKSYELSRWCKQERNSRRLKIKKKPPSFHLQLGVRRPRENIQTDLLKNVGRFSIRTFQRQYH